MKILHINRLYDGGGAARAAIRLHTGLLNQSQKSMLFVAMNNGKDPNVISFRSVSGLFNRLLRRLRAEIISRSLKRYQNSKPAGYELFSDDRSEYGIGFVNQLPKSNLINLHWVSDFVDYRSFFLKVVQHTPIVWTLHDMNAFTGGCHYDQGCQKYRSRCGACHQLGSNDSSDLSRKIWQRKYDVLRRVKPHQLHIVTPSHWLAEKAEESALLSNFSVETIPNALDTDTFSPLNYNVARDALGIARNAKVLLFIAGTVTNQRKGLGLLSDVINDLSDMKDLFLLSVGEGNLNTNAHTAALHLGQITNDRMLSLVYSAADLLVIPSTQDNLPNTVLESFACGTPAIGFDVGGLPDMIRQGVTGYVVPSQDVYALRKNIVKLLNDPVKIKMMSVNCREIAVKEYSLKIQAQRYIELYKRILNQFSKITKLN